MPLTAEQKAWAEKRLAAGDSEDDVFGFLESQELSVDLSGPQGIGAGPMVNLPAGGRATNPVAEGAADIQKMQQGYNRGLVRGIPAAAASVALAPVTGGMSLLPAMATDFAGVAVADLLTQTAMKGFDPSREINPMESVEIGGKSALAGGALRGVLSGMQRFGAGLQGTSEPAIRQVQESAPAGGLKAWRMIRQRPPEAEFQVAESAQQSIQQAKSKSFPKAQAAVAAYTQDVDTAPIYQRILSRLRSPVGNAKAVTPAEQAANKALDDLADTLPDKMTMTELEDYLQRIRTPVKDQIGQVGGSLKANDVKDISAFIRKYRDQLLSGDPATAEGPAAFQASSTEMEAIKRFRKLILDSKGNLKPNAEQLVRRMPTNRVLMQVFDRYDAANGTTYGQQARDIWLSRQWSPSKQQSATSLIEAVNRIGRGATLTAKAASYLGPKGAKFIAVAAPPRGLPSRGAAAYEAFRAAMEEEKRRSP